MTGFASGGLALLCAAVIAVFFMLLPDVRFEWQLPKNNGRRKDLLACGLITVAYAAISFINLGDTVGPQTFVGLQSGDSVTIKLSEPTEIDRVLLFTGYTVGEYTVEASGDGESWTELFRFDQNYAEILKWREPELNQVSELTSFVRITALEENPGIGEIGLFAGEKLLSVSPEGKLSEALTDEQNLIPEEITWLNSSYFDEVYHVRTAEEHLQGIQPYEISHPPLGKIIISLGIRLFGLVPFGWRFFGTLAGILMLPAIYAFLNALFENTAVSFFGTVMLASDFMHFTQTRIATIDSFAVFFIILMYWCMFEYTASESGKWLFFSGLTFGLGTACKWTCLYAGAGLAVIWLSYRITRLVRARDRRKEAKCCLRSIGQCLLFFVLIPAVIYWVSYIPYGKAEGLSMPSMLFGRKYAEIVLRNQEFMFSYHSGVRATHPYSSKWYQWVLDIRPILYYLKYYPDGSRSSIGTFVNPLLCWGGTAAILMLLYIALTRRDKKAAFILAGYFAQLVPWMFIERVQFEYHYFACTVFLILAMGYLFSLMMTAKSGKMLSAMVAVSSSALFVLFYPVLGGMRIGEDWQSLLGWLPTWPF